MYTDKQWSTEEQRLEQVRTYITQRIEELEQTVEDRRADVVSLRKGFWDDITVNVDNMDEMIETMASIQQQSLVLYGQEKGLEHAGQMLERLEQMRDSPYFGRIDFKEEGFNDEEQIYIGIGSVMDEESGEPYVYDWRAPISSMFYDYSSGPVEYQSPDGPIRGEMTLKRQYIIEQGKLVSMFDTGLHIGDEMLQRLLDKRADDKMKNIVSTIQSEQNKIIRDDRHDVLIVQGAAGSGKTSAALQRIAFLLYKHRQTLTAEQMLLLTPNEVFQDYISGVLPELGESNIKQSTMHDYVADRLGEELLVEEAYTHLEKLFIKPDDAIRDRGIAFKASLAYLQGLDRYLEHLLVEGMIFKPFKIGSRTLISTKMLQEMFYTTYADRSLQGRLEAMRLRIGDLLKEQAKTLTNQTYRKTLQQPGYHGTSEEILQRSRKRVKKRMIPLRKMAMDRKFVDWYALYMRLLENDHLCEQCFKEALPEGWSEVSSQTINSLKAHQVPYEDSAPLLYVKEQFEGFQTDNNVRYVFIDEAQDYSAIQLAIIRRMFPRSKMTMLGDLNQSVFSLTGLSTYKYIETMFETSNVGMIRLAKSYRSTQEIVEFTKQILRDGEQIEAFSRSGEAPKVQSYASIDTHTQAIVEHIAALKNKGCQSIAIIGKTAQECERAFDQLQHFFDEGDIQLITSTTRAFGAGILVIPSYMAKGLEFDGVIIYNASKDVYGHENDRKLLYTVCTRALHYLSVYILGEASPLLPAKGE